nr:hypothetical protein [Tanacetum cinerariifolium]
MSQEKEASDAANTLRKHFEQGYMDQIGVTKAGNTNSFNTISNPVNAASTSGTFSSDGPSSPLPDAFIPANTLLYVDQDDSQILDLEDTAEYFQYDKSLGKDASKQKRNDDKIEELNLTDGADTEVIIEDKGSGEKDGSIANQVSTARPEVSTDSVPVNVSAATLSTPPTTTIIFGDEDLTIAQTLIKLRSEKEKVKGFAFRDVEEPPRLTRSTTTLQPLLTIDQKDKEQESSKSDEKESADYKHEKEELRTWLTVVSDEKETVDPEIFSTKYPIVDWESQNLGNIDMEDLHVYKIIRANGNTSYHKSLSSMLRKFDRQELVDLHRLVMKRFKDNTL